MPLTGHRLGVFHKEGAKEASGKHGGTRYFAHRKHPELLAGFLYDCDLLLEHDAPVFRKLCTPTCIQELNIAEVLNNKKEERKKETKKERERERGRERERARKEEGVRKRKRKNESATEKLWKDKWCTAFQWKDGKDVS